MWEIVTAGGWLMAPIILCSVVALAIVADRLFHLRRSRVVPPDLVTDTLRLAGSRQLTSEKLQALREGSPLGRVLAAGLAQHGGDREAMTTAIEEVGGHVAHDLGRYLNALGTIAAITPLLGLLGTVIGMISVFTHITAVGVGNASQLAGGISQALITTAGGLSVAVPALVFYRHFRARVETLVIEMEREALRLIDVMHGRQQQAPVRPAPNLRASA